MAGFTSNGYFDVTQDADNYDIPDSILTLANQGVRGLAGNDTLKGLSLIHISEPTRPY